MKHHIIVKFKPEVSTEEKDRLIPEIKALFDNTVSIDGIHSVEIQRNCIDRANRYDIMIIISMEPEALPEYDECIWHKRWKAEYSDIIEKKAIFDCM